MPEETYDHVEYSNNNMKEISNDHECNDESNKDPKP
jgi:hypothetical protein